MTAATPEKKLLEIIEKTGSANDAGKEATKSGAVHAIGKSRSSGGAGFKPDISSVFAGFKQAVSLGSALEFDIKKINKILTVITALVTCYMVFYFLVLSKTMSKNVNFSADDVSKLIGKNMQFSNVATPSKSNDYLAVFLDKTRRRDLFKPVKGEKKSGMAEQNEPKGRELFKNLKLVGISVSPDPNGTYAMVEDMTTKATYFLKKDETILGAKITAIENDHVVLNYQGNQMELR